VVVGLFGMRGGRRVMCEGGGVVGGGWEMEVKGNDDSSNITLREI
jgi:hypothetical protein